MLSLSTTNETIWLDSTNNIFLILLDKVVSISVVHVTIFPFFFILRIDSYRLMYSGGKAT